MKLWHDDIRRPPDDSWTWARTNQEAIWLILENGCDEASLDHDLGLHRADHDAPDAHLGRGMSPNGTGYDLCVAMVRLRCVPPRVTIHSWNPEGAAWMAGVLREATDAVTIKPWEPPQ